MDRPTCATCIYWQIDKHELAEGTCRATRPTSTGFPPCSAGDWCAIHQDLATWLLSHVPALLSEPLPPNHPLPLKETDRG